MNGTYAPPEFNDARNTAQLACHAHARLAVLLGDNEDGAMSTRLPQTASPEECCVVMFAVLLGIKQAFPVLLRILVMLTKHLDVCYLGFTRPRDKARMEVAIVSHLEGCILK